ncbi:MAG: ATP-binding protein [Oscillospiraceae bacterium]|nr:ATP-binding protein [Oscillospiraceae bacterium]
MAKSMAEINFNLPQARFGKVKTVALKLLKRIAKEWEHENALLYESSQKLLAARDIDDIIAITNAFLVRHMGHSVLFYTKDPRLPDAGIFAKSPSEQGPEALFASERERERAHAIYVEPFSHHSVEQQEESVHYVPVVSKGKVFGVIGIFCGEKHLSETAILFIQAVAAQVALTLESHTLAEEQHKIRIDAEREKTRAILLRAISHDLRTPITSILGASSTMLEQEDVLDRETNRQLLTDIKENAEWLIRTAENLLTVTRISQESVRVKKTLEAAEEVVAQAVSIVRSRFPDCYIHIRSPKKLLFVPMEATLISQVLINLLGNSIKNSEKESLILLDLKRHGNDAVFSVSDHGRGIPEEVLDNLFEICTRDGEHAVDSVQGMGIGLSICKTIIQAHGGRIRGKNKPDGGAHFSFTLPLKEG